MQFLKISKDTTLSSLSNRVGSRNVDAILSLNSLTRTPQIGKAFNNVVDNIMKTSPAVSADKKISLLNTFTSDAEVFETACLQTESQWKVLSTQGCFSNALKIPESITLKDSTDIIGSSDAGVSSLVYKKAISSLKTSGTINSEIFSTYSNAKVAGLNVDPISTTATSVWAGFSIPWGSIQLYSSLADETIDIPVYPEELTDGRQATYTQMPDTIYQYEPWMLYESSGPRTLEYTFHFHRDMWTGNHLDGNANKLIRFCEACCYPRYSGSAVVSSTVKLYINGSCHISGILTSTSTKWSGPLGHDGWYLECELTLTITEIAESPLNFDKVKALGIIGGY